MLQKRKIYIIGLDEVGRGALAGPVAVAAVALPANGKWRTANSPKGKLRDSKKLTARKRNLWFEYFVQQPALCYSIARVYPRQIEKLNISQAANMAAERAYKKLLINHKSPLRRQAGKIINHKVFLDGGLYLGNGREKMRIVERNDAKNFRKNSRSISRCFASTIVRGDEKITAIKVASIIAKVCRDGYMERLAKKYPPYGFGVHKGYGTQFHFKAIKKHGPSKAHRLTFLH